MLGYLNKLFGREATGRTAKERLRLVLVHDRSKVSPEVLEALREDLIEVISKYMDIDIKGTEVTLDNEDNSVMLVANIPVRDMKRNLQSANR